MIVQNAVVCNKCDDFIVSKHRHDFVTCKCGNVSVDGGQAYLRRAGGLAKDEAGKLVRSYTDLSWEIPDELYKACAQAVLDAENAGRNHIGIANAVMRKLREAEYIRGEGDYWVTAASPHLDEIWVCEPNGEYSRYKKVIDG